MKIKVIRKTELTFFDKDELQDSVKGSDVEHVQISDGQFIGINKQYELPHSFVSTGVYSQKVFARGTLPQDMLTIGVILDSKNGSGCFSGKRLDPGNVIIIPEGYELDYMIPKGTTWSSFNISRKFLAEDIVDILPSNEFIVIPSLSANTRRILSIMKELTQDKSNLSGEEIEQYQLDNITNIITFDFSGDYKCRKFNIPEKQKIMKLVHSYMQDNINEPISVKQFVKEIDISHRKLNYAFQDMFNMTFKQFIKYNKINQLREILLSGNQNISTIKEAAKVCGINHMGRLSQEYYQIFNEYPMQTLHRPNSKK